MERARWCLVVGCLVLVTPAPGKAAGEGKLASRREMLLGGNLNCSKAAGKVVDHKMDALAEKIDGTSIGTAIKAVMKGASWRGAKFAEGFLWRSRTRPSPRGRVPITRRSPGRSTRG
jgi:hypothetical protein